MAEDALDDRPVTLIAGARQSGKSTLALSVAGAAHPARYLTFDDPSTLAAAGDPAGFLAGLTGDVVLDEVQLVPELFRALKAAVDRDRRPGRFPLTGSVQVLLLPRLSESLAGRMEILALWPLAQCEVTDRWRGSQSDVHARSGGFQRAARTPGARGRAIRTRRRAPPRRRRPSVWRQARGRPGGRPLAGAGRRAHGAVRRGRLRPPAPNCAPARGSGIIPACCGCSSVG